MSSSPILTLQHLHLSFPLKTLFQDAGFTLYPGEKVGVLGLNGHGKSSLFKILTGEILPDKSHPSCLRDQKKGLSFFLIPQELPLLDTNLDDYFYHFYPEWKRAITSWRSLIEKSPRTPEDELKAHDLLESLQQTGEPQVHQRYVSYLKRYGLHETQNYTVLSGGEQRKVGLALGLSSPCDVLLWDEPTNHLDIAQIEDFEDDILKSDKAMLLITHDREFLNQTVNRIIHIQQGKIASFKGTYQDYIQHLILQEQQRQQTLQKLTNTHRRELAWMRRGVKARGTKSKKRQEQFHQLSDAIVKLKDRVQDQSQFTISSSERLAKRVLTAEGLWAQNTTGRYLYKDLFLSIERGQKIALCGPNGTGKSTLIRHLLDDLTFHSHEALKGGGEIKKLSQLSVGYFQQKRDDLPLAMPMGKWLGDGEDMVSTPQGGRVHLAAYVERFLFNKDDLSKPLGSFSGGEKNRLKLAKFMQKPQDIWIFDEPTNDLDLETLGLLEDELAQAQVTLLLISHDRTFIESTTTICWWLEAGVLTAYYGGLSQALEGQELKFLQQAALKPELKSPLPNEKVETQISKPTPKLSNKQKQRLQNLPELISKCEERIAQLEKELMAVFSEQVSQEQRARSKLLTAELEKMKADCESLYNEWTLLESL
jgi:ATP-binding cassette subfamily F protein uup